MSRNEPRNFMRTGKAVAVLAAAAMLAACAGNSAGGESNQVRVQYYPGVLFQQTLQVAQGEGFFEDEEVTVDFVNSKSGPEGLAAVQSGSIDLASTNVDTFLTAAAKGADVQAVAATAGPYFTLLMQSDMERQHAGDGWQGVMKDLVGKRLGVTSRGAGTEGFYRALFSEAGIDPESATYVAIGQGATAITAFQTGQVDSVMGYEPMATVLTSSGDAVVGIDIANGEGPKRLANLGATVVYFGMKDDLNANADAIADFVKGLEKAAAWSQDPENLDGLVKVMEPTVIINDVDDPVTALENVIKSNLAANTLVDVSSDDLSGWVKFLRDYQGMELPEDDDFVKSLIWSAN